MNEGEATTLIDRPVEDVFARLTDWDHYPDWNSHLTRVRQTSEGPLATGSTVLFVGKMLGRGFESESTVTEYVANQKLVTRNFSGPFSIEVQYTLEPSEGGTKFTTLVRGESKGFLKVAEPVAVKLTRNLFEAASESLKALLEARVA